MVLMPMTLVAEVPPEDVDEEEDVPPEPDAPDDEEPEELPGSFPPVEDVLDVHAARRPAHRRMTGEREAGRRRMVGAL